MLDPTVNTQLGQYIHQDDIDLLEKIWKRDSREDYFFSHTKKLKWFHPLKELGYFDPSTASGSEMLPNGSSRRPKWKVLPYLEAVSGQVGTLDGAQYVSELLEIIQTFAECDPAETRHAWWYFVKIMANLPNASVPIELVAVVPDWLSRRDGHDLLSTETIRKLLPKFLNDSPTSDDVAKAEVLLRGITAITWRRRAAALGSPFEAVSAVDSYWLVEVLVKGKLAERVGRYCSSGMVTHFIDTVRAILRHEHPEHSVELSSRGTTYLLTVNHESADHFSCSLVLAPRGEASDGVVGFDIIDPGSAPAFIDALLGELRERGLVLQEEEIRGNFADLYYGKYDDFSYIWFRSLHDPGDLRGYDVRETYALVLRDIFRTRISHELGYLADLVRLTREVYRTPLFWRYILYLVGLFWDRYRAQFWALVDEGILLLFDSTAYEAEVYNLLERNVKRLSPEDHRRLGRIISDGPRVAKPDEHARTRAAFWRQRWYSALKVDQVFSRLYDEQRAITGEDERLSFREKRFQWGHGSAPRSAAELLGESNDAIARFLADFRTVDSWEGPSVESLGEQFRRAVAQDPGKFSGNLAPFMETDFYYVEMLLRGFRTAWTDGSNIDWERVLTFAMAYVDRTAFWDDHFDSGLTQDFRCNHLSVVGEVGDLLEEGAKVRERTIPREVLPLAEEVALLLVDRMAFKSREGYDDPTMHLLNSPGGKVLLGFAHLAIRVAQGEAVAEGPRWSEPVRQRFDRLINEGVVDVYTLIGEFLPTINWLDEGWVHKKVSSFLQLEREPLWSAFVYAYLYRSRFNDNVYRMMRPHFKRCMDEVMDRGETSSRLVQHVAMGYLRELEDLPPAGLMGRLLEGWHHERTAEIIDFFWHERQFVVPEESEGPDDAPSAEKERVRRRILDFWRALYKAFEGKPELNVAERSMIAHTGKLAVFIERIDNDSFPMLLMAAKAFRDDSDMNVSFFIEYLNRLKDRGGDVVIIGRRIGELFLKMLETFAPDYDPSHIAAIVEHMYGLQDAQATEKVNDICNQYTQYRRYFLKEIYLRHRSA